MFHSSDFFITADVGSGHGQSWPHDVVRIRRALDETGYGRSPANPSTRYDKSIHDNIVGFQDDFGLKQDGWLEPGGPTETAMSLALNAKRDGGRDGMQAFREPFATMNQDGFKFLPNDTRSSDQSHNWLAPDGNQMTDAQRDDIIFSKGVLWGSGLALPHLIVIGKMPYDVSGPFRTRTNGNVAVQNLTP